MSFNRDGFSKRPQGKPPSDPLRKAPRPDDGFTPLVPGEPKPKAPARPDTFTVPVPPDPPKAADPPQGVAPAWLFGGIPLGAAPRKTSVPRPRPEIQKPETDEDTQELLAYLDEVIGDYERHVGKIGELGFTAPMLLYYRDEIQEALEILEEEPEVDTQPYWRRVVEHDNLLKARRQDLVDEIGHANFKQYQIINDPPKEHWWWFLNRETAGPPPPTPFWMFWKR